ncbi:DUF3050 domain-containing protein [Mechercharimyces sp. CAU 1602]|uniref:DUF3050 domain-containing protein n=1 Tax=Mechercharimyces sp. CAU 1602 TaxID=2973933 RepID=UPI002161BD4F|nr:DUF3050 domain-containing protein [Mechercharimyces sp. CAU 1602]MCS1350949.1 DUF3050 domain-containing protein [Mechercharimyces sp. CAU 1602]
MDSIRLQHIQTERERLLEHPVYHAMTNPERVKIFMKYHVFAVWDFMTLLKRLQQEFTCTSTPWFPVAEPAYARFINEIVLEEETDEDGEGGYISHFELYLRAMKEAGADTKPITTFLESLRTGQKVEEASAILPDTVKSFVRHNVSLADEGKPHEVAAAFFFGREGLIPDMFTNLVEGMRKSGLSAKWLPYYLERHIELDQDDHGPLAEKLLTSLCEGDRKRSQEAEAIALESLTMRISLWDGVLEEIEANQV